MYAGSRPFVRTVIDGLDVVAVGIEGKGRVVAGMIMPLPRPAIVAAACRQDRRMKAIDSGMILGLESDMHVRHGSTNIDP